VHHRFVAADGAAVEVLRGANFSLPPGGFGAILGPSGCGKSTLLRMAGGLLTPTSGAVSWVDAADRPWLEPGRAVPPGTFGFCFQDARLLPWRSVWANVALPLDLAGVPKAAQRERAHALLDQVGLSGFANVLPDTLSGGMRMRVALARALATEPKVLLLDEPFGALDEITRAELDEALRALWVARPMTVLLVTHAIDEAVFLADTVWVLDPRPGHVRGTVGLGDSAPGERRDALRTTPAFGEAVAMGHRLLAEGMAAARARPR
jgi:NitT/TauT family transport system ATP-binding protein